MKPRIQLQGVPHAATPYFWRTFGSEKALNRFLAKTIRPDGGCWLHVNPNLPKQADFSANDIFDRVMHPGKAGAA